MKKGTFGKILKYLQPYAFLIVLTVLLALINVTATLAVPYLAGLGVDCIIGKGAVDFARLFRLLAVIGGCIAVTAVSQWCMNVLSNRVAYHVLADIRTAAFRKIQILPLKYLDGRAYGETASVVISDAEQFSDGLLLAFNQFFTGIATVLGVLVILFVLRWEVALVVLLITPLSLVTAKFISSHTYSMFKKQSEVRAEQTAFIDEMVGNLKVVKAFGHEEENGTVFKEINDRYKKCSLKAVFFSSTVNPATRFVNAVVFALVALVGAFLVIDTANLEVAFTVGNLTSVLNYATQYTKPFNEISEVVTEFQNALACAARLFALIEEEPEVSDMGNLELGQAKGEVSLEQVKFSYTPEQKLIENLNVHAPAGKRVAIVGPTGCGKTTLINLLMRFYDVDGGSVKVDGKDVRALTRKSLRENYGMVLQETWLKEATVRENLCMGRQNATEEEMIEAAKAAHAHNFIMRLPKGYETVIGEEGNLSQGQKQLLCIARVMLCRPPMLILDEATSNIDTRTELKVQDAFQKLMVGRTCFIVAHRLSTIQNADLILVMKSGSIIEQGTHKELLSRRGFYYELYNAQFAE